LKQLIRRLALIESLENEKRGLPARDGRPNLSAMAEACKFDRGVFYTNQAAKLLLDDALGRLGLDTDEPADLSEFDRAQLREEGKVRADARSKALEEELLLLRAENASLRAENDQFHALRRLLAETGRVP
jgi:hypothetical protein